MQPGRPCDRYAPTWRRHRRGGFSRENPFVIFLVVLVFYERVDPKQIEALIPENRDSLQATPQAAAPTDAQAKSKAAKAAAADKVETPGVISIDNFARINLRIAKIVDCKAVEGSDKVLQLTLDIDEEKTCNVFSGIKSAYQPEQLVGKLPVMVANLARHAR
jgi:methionyl-tRNA synthetase